jgi:hypothetical protein
MKTTKPDQLPTDWTANLPAIDPATLRPALDELQGLERDAGRKFGPTRRHVTRTARARMIDARRRAAAIQDISELPQAGEVIHLLWAKRAALFDVISAVLHFRAPATIKYLGVCTLGFSVANVEGLAEMLDGGQVAHLDLIYSIYFRSLEKSTCERMTAELGKRGARIIAFLQHSKILILETTDGQSYVIESSANLRSCASIEQVCIFNDRSLAAFHRGWINGLFTEAKK